MKKGPSSCCGPCSPLGSNSTSIPDRTIVVDAAVINWATWREEGILPFVYLSGLPSVCIGGWESVRFYRTRETERK